MFHAADFFTTKSGRNISDRTKLRGISRDAKWMTWRFCLKYFFSIKIFSELKPPRGSVVVSRKNGIPWLIYNDQWTFLRKQITYRHISMKNCITAFLWKLFLSLVIFCYVFEIVPQKPFKSILLELCVNVWHNLNEWLHKITFHSLLFLHFLQLMTIMYYLYTYMLNLAAMAVDTFWNIELGSHCNLHLFNIVS